MLKYTKIRNRQQSFLRLSGLSVEQFDILMKRVRPSWKRRITRKYKRPGRNYKLSLEDRVLMVLVYYRSYVTQEFIGYLFGVDDSRVCRIIKMLEPILARAVALKKECKLGPEELMSIVIDATEQPIERPKKGQRAFYSGKKKRHTLKTEVRATRKGRIIKVSKSVPGSVHDFALHKREKPIVTKVPVFADSGYQGLQEKNGNAILPFKAKKDIPLAPEKKFHNHILSSLRVSVEHVFSRLKTFKILSYPYRNKLKAYGVKFNIISGLNNLKLGYC